MRRAGVLIRQIAIIAVSCAAVLIALYYLAGHIFAEPNGVDRIVAGKNRAQRIAGFSGMPYGDYHRVVYAEDRLYLSGYYDAAPLICLSPLGRILWKKKIADESIIDIARAPHNGLYVLLTGGLVIAVSGEGMKQWSFTPDEAIYSGRLSTDAAGIVYFDDNQGRIYAVGVDGALRWKAKQDFKQGERSQMADLSDGMLPSDHHPILGDDCVFQTCYGTTAYALDGEILWHRAGGEHVVAWLSAPDNLAIACGYRRGVDGVEAGKVIALDDQGEMVWETEYRDLYFEGYPAVGANLTVHLPLVQADLAGHKTFGLLALSPDGRKRWFFETPSWCLEKPQVAADGSLWFASFSRPRSNKADRIYHLSSGGELINSYAIPSGTVGFVDLSPAGVLYVMGFNEVLYAISP